MPQVEIFIGGRTFEVACQEGEEHFLHSAAAMLDAEAATLAEQIGRLPEARMLLMAGCFWPTRPPVWKTSCARRRSRRWHCAPSWMMPKRSQHPRLKGSKCLWCLSMLWTH